MGPPGPARRSADVARIREGRSGGGWKRQFDADRAFEALAEFGAIPLERDEDDPRVYRPRRLDLD